MGDKVELACCWLEGLGSYISQDRLSANLRNLGHSVIKISGPTTAARLNCHGRLVVGKPARGHYLRCSFFLILQSACTRHTYRPSIPIARPRPPPRLAGVRAHVESMVRLSQQALTAQCKKAPRLYGEDSIRTAQRCAVPKHRHT